MSAFLPATEIANTVAHIDPSWLQYIGHEFRDFFSGTVDPTGALHFHSSDIPLIDEIYRRLVAGGETPDAIRHRLWRKSRRLRIMAVTSGKGGVGKTTVAVNLAVAFAQHGRRVLLVDADLGMANVHVYAGVQPVGSILDVIEGARPLQEAVTPGPSGIRILCGKSGIARAADVDVRWIESLGSELRRAGGDYDVILIDTGAGISAQIMSFLAMADDIVVVATPNLASTLDAYGVVKVAREMQLAGQIHLLVNHAENPEQAEGVLARIEACARQFLQFEPARLGVLPRDAAYEAACQSRSPLVLTGAGGPHAQHFLALARQLLARAEAAGEASSHPSSAAA